MQGTVTFAGQPIESGTIMFIPGEGVVGPPVQVIVEQGKYTTPEHTGPAIGENLVQITAVRKTGKMIKFDGKEFEERQQYLPPKYNDQSILKVDIKPGENQHDFPL